MRTQRNMGTKLFLGAALGLALSSAFAGEKAGNGGALVERNGEILSFKTAGAVVQLPIEALPVPEDLPEMDEFNMKLSGIVLPAEFMDSFRKALFPGVRRRYYKVDITKIPEKTLTEIMAAYKDAIDKKTDDHVVLGAITKGTETFLFDSYYKLKKQNSKFALLAHEAFWVLYPNSDYPTVVDAEMEMESCLDEEVENFQGHAIYCSGLVKSLQRLTKNSNFSLVAAAQYDFLSSKQVFPNENIPLNFLFPDSFFEGSYSRYHEMSVDDLREIVFENLKKKRKEYPELQVVRELMSRLDRLQVFGLDAAFFSSLYATDDGLHLAGKVNDLYQSLSRGLSGIENLGFTPNLNPRALFYTNIHIIPVTDEFYRCARREEKGAGFPLIKGPDSYTSPMPENFGPVHGGHVLVSFE